MCEPTEEAYGVSPDCIDTLQCQGSYSGIASIRLPHRAGSRREAFILPMIYSAAL